MKIKEMAGSVLHFALNRKLSSFGKSFLLRINRSVTQETTEQNFESGNEVKLTLC
jgi:hypothetical protein